MTADDARKAFENWIAAVEQAGIDVLIGHLLLVQQKDYPPCIKLKMLNTVAMKLVIRLSEAGA